MDIVDYGNLQGLGRESQTTEDIEKGYLRHVAPHIDPRPLRRRS
jgi:hypothetical protein